MLTVKFFKPFPDWSDPKRVCTCQVWVLSNPLCKSHVWLCTSHWWWDLSDTLTFVKMLIFEMWISMKSSFDQVSITRPTTVSFSSIFFMFDLGERSLHACFHFKFIYSLSFIQGWLLLIKGVTCVKSSYFHSLFLFHSWSLCTWENQSSDEENMIAHHLSMFCPRVLLVIQ